MKASRKKVETMLSSDTNVEEKKRSISEDLNNLDFHSSSEEDCDESSSVSFAVVERLKKKPTKKVVLGKKKTVRNSNFENDYDDGGADKTTSSYDEPRNPDAACFPPHWPIASSKPTTYNISSSTAYYAKKHGYAGENASIMAGSNCCDAGNNKQIEAKHHQIAPGAALLQCTGADIQLSKSAMSKPNLVKNKGRYLIVLPGLLSFKLASNGYYQDKTVAAKESNDEEKQFSNSAEHFAEVEPSTHNSIMNSAATALQPPPAVVPLLHLGTLHYLETESPVLKIKIPIGLGQQKTSSSSSGDTASTNKTILKFTGEKISPTSTKFMALTVKPNQGTVACKDIFSSIIVFGDAQWGHHDDDDDIDDDVIPASSCTPAETKKCDESKLTDNDSNLNEVERTAMNERHFNDDSNMPEQITSHQTMADATVRRSVRRSHLSANSDKRIISVDSQHENAVYDEKTIENKVDLVDSSIDQNDFAALSSPVQECKKSPMTTIKRRSSRNIANERELAMHECDSDEDPQKERQIMCRSHHSKASTPPKLVKLTASKPKNGLTKTKSSSPANKNQKTKNSEDINIGSTASKGKIENLPCTPNSKLKGEDPINNKRKSQAGPDSQKDDMVSLAAADNDDENEHCSSVANKRKRTCLESKSKSASSPRTPPTSSDIAWASNTRISAGSVASSTIIPLANASPRRRKRPLTPALAKARRLDIGDEEFIFIE